MSVRRPLRVAVACAALLLTMAPASAAVAEIAPRTLVPSPAELPGFAQAEHALRSSTSAARFAAKVLDLPARRARLEAQALKRMGFREGVLERFQAAEAGGLAEALVFGSSRGAVAELKRSLAEARSAPGIEFGAFPAGGVPGAVDDAGLYEDEGESRRDANVFFTVGRCFFVIGDSLPATAGVQAAARAPLAGASAVHARVRRSCERP